MGGQLGNSCGDGGVRMIRIRDIRLPVGHDNAALMDEIAKIMCLDIIYPCNSYPDLSFEILR